MKIGSNDDLEISYMAKFRQMASEFGVFTEYERDRAARDIGLHFTQETHDGGRLVTPSLVWFQMKGITSEHLPADKFKILEEISLSLETKHLTFWHILPEPTYLVVYVECEDKFYVIDVKEYIKNKWGDKILSSNQKSHTVKINKKNSLDKHAFGLILRNNLVRILKERFNGESSETRIFLRDSQIIKELRSSRENGTKIRMRVIKWMSKMRTEVYFEMEDKEQSSWKIFRTHWEFSLQDIQKEFPYLDISVDSRNEFTDYNDESDLYGRENLLELPNGQISEAVDTGEMFEHFLNIKLNDTGNVWANTLDILERSEIISVPKGATFVSVAPWHSRDV